MDYLPWLAWSSSFLPLLLIAYFVYKSWKEEKFRFEELEPSETLGTFTDQDYSNFGERVLSNLSEPEREKLFEAASSKLKNLEDKNTLDSVDEYLIREIINSKADPKMEDIFLGYLHHKKFVFHYENNPTFDLRQSYSNFFCRLGKMCEDEFEEVHFEDGIIINGEKEIDIWSFIVSLDERKYREYGGENYHPGKKGSVPIRMNCIIDKFNEVLEKYDKEKRFFYETTDYSHHPFYGGSVWYGTPKEIEKIVKELGIEVRMSSEEDLNLKNPEIEHQV